MQSVRFWRSVVTVGLVGALSIGPSSTTLLANSAVVGWYDLSVSGNDVTIILHVDGNYTDLPTDCGLAFQPPEAWPNTIAFPTSWGTNTGLTQGDISGDLNQTGWGGSGTSGCNGGGLPGTNNYDLTFQFTDGTAGDHQFSFRLVTFDAQGGTAGDTWVYIPYSI